MKPLPKKLEDDLENAKHYRGKVLSSNEVENIEDGNRQRKSIPSALAAAFDDSVERAMFDEILGPMLKPRGRLPAGSGFEATKLSTRPSSGASHTPSDFTTTILQRLQKLETESKEQRMQLAEKIRENQRLEEELNCLKLSVETPQKLLKEMEKIKSENEILQKKCLEMEQFLADYGLIWVGSESSQSNPYNEVENNDAIDNDEIGGERHRISFAEFVKCINALNDIIFSEPTQIVTDNKKARLAHASELVERIKITFYSNGLMIKRGPFRSCSSNSYQTFMKDVVDGYFPSEFREIYPDGVTFDVIDKHDIVYQLGETEGNLTAEQLLEKVPKTIVRNGELIDMRQQLRLKLNYNPNEKSDTNNAVSSKSTLTEEIEEKVVTDNAKCVHQLIELPNRMSKAASIDDDSTHGMGRMVQVHIKGIPNVTLRGQFYEQNTVEDIKEAVKHYCNENLSSQNTSRFEFRTAFPSKLLFGGMTLSEAGLTPNGTVYVKVV